MSVVRMTPSSLKLWWLFHFPIICLYLIVKLICWFHACRDEEQLMALSPTAKNKMRDRTHTYLSYLKHMFSDALGLANVNDKPKNCEANKYLQFSYFEINGYSLDSIWKSLFM